MTDGNKPDDKSSGLLVSVAETIGSTLGSLAAKAGAAQKSIGETTNEVVRKVKTAKRKVSAKKKTRKAPTKKSSAKRTAQVRPIQQARLSFKEQAFARPVIPQTSAIDAIECCKAGTVLFIPQSDDWVDVSRASCWNPASQHSDD